MELNHIRQLWTNKPVCQLPKNVTEDEIGFVIMDYNAEKFGCRECIRVLQTSWERTDAEKVEGD